MICTFVYLQSNGGQREDNGSYGGVVICDDELHSESSDEQTYDSFCSDSEESVHSIEAPSYSPIAIDDIDSGDENLDFDILLPVANEPCKNC